MRTRIATSYSRMATSYSNIFMGHLEQQLLSSQKHKPRVWWSYINDVFIIWTIWTSGKENLQHFMNKFHPTIKMTRDWFYSVATLLVIKIHLKTIQSTQTSMLDQQHPPILTPEQLPPRSLQTSHPFWSSNTSLKKQLKRGNLQTKLIYHIHVFLGKMFRQGKPMFQEIEGGGDWS